jgi:stress-induced-phosphoprotein 1
MFNDPDLFAKIGRNQTTKHLLEDSSLGKKLHSIQTNPELLQREIIQDERFMLVLEMLLRINLSG